MNENIKTKHVIGAMLILYVMFGFISAYVPHMVAERNAERLNDIVDKCRVRYMLMNDDGTKSYVCESVYNDDAEMMIIHENESRHLKRNGYINRPVFIFNDGTVE